MTPDLLRPHPLAFQARVSPREKAISELRAIMVGIDQVMEAMRLQRLDLNDLILKLACGGITAEEALNQWQRAGRGHEQAHHD